MELQVEKLDNAAVVTVKDEFLDASNNRAFKEQIAPELAGVKHLLLDLHNVQFIDSSGLAAILTCLKQLSVQGGDLRICQITSPVRALFDLVKMGRIVEVYKTRAEALASFTKTA
jgi:anti-sigma B factor antagonist